MHIPVSHRPKYDGVLEPVTRIGELILLYELLNTVNFVEDLQNSVILDDLEVWEYGFSPKVYLDIPMSIAQEALQLFRVIALLFFHVPFLREVLDHLSVEIVVEDKFWMTYVPHENQIVVEHIYEWWLDLPVLYVDCFGLL